MNNALSSARIYTDFGGLTELRAGARRQSPQARKEVARQFEAIFIQIMLRSMRQAGEAVGEGESDQVKFYRQMFDQQVALELANGRGMGLSRVIERQLGVETAPAQPDGFKMPERGAFAAIRQAVTAMEQQEATVVGPVREPTEQTAWPPGDPVQFVRRLWPAAERAAGRLGLDPRVILAQAALESGWGRHSVGRNSHNLFGIKADGSWDGDRVEVSTTEFRGGVPVRERAAFRSYASPEESIEDYVNFLQENPRYRAALERAGDARGFLKELQRAGYATDPAYARKIENILASPRFAQALASLEAG